jgi:sorbitol-specific phosphotransferase system component IIC
LSSLNHSGTARLGEGLAAQAAGNPVQAYTVLCAAVGHVQVIADPLASAIAKRLPERFAQRERSLCP